MKNPKSYTVELWTVIFMGLAFVGGMALNAYSIAEKIATKPYVDDKLLEAKKYTDEKIDLNQQKMLLELEKHTSTVEAIKTKLDILGDEILHKRR